MPVPALIRPGPVQVKQVLRAVEYRCELCGGECPAHHLEIHFIPRPGTGLPRRNDLHRRILVLCSRCHRDLHCSGCTLRDQVHLVSLRDPEVSRKIRRALTSPLHPYTAPESFDPERFFLDPSPVPWGWVV